VEIEKKFSSKQ